MRCPAEEFSGAVGARPFMHDVVRAEARRRGIEPTAPACAGHRLSRIACVGILTLLTACGKENRFIAPPPPKVTVELPMQQMVTPYLEATGDAAAVKKGTPLFVIEPQPYKVQLEQAQAAEEGAKATLINNEAEFTRQQQLEAKDVTTQASLDKARANRDTARASVLQAQANTHTAEINLGYTTVVAPFDGVVAARKVSIGELVGGGQTSELASIVQLDPIWVWFNPSERDVQRARNRMVERGVNIADLVNKVPVEAGLQTETGYPHKGLLNYTAPDVNQSTGTLQVRGIFENADGVVEQRRVQLGQTTGEMRVIESGLKPDERVVVSGILGAVPGQKVDPQLQTPKSAAAEPAGSNRGAP